MLTDGRWTNATRNRTSRLRWRTQLHPVPGYLGSACPAGRATYTKAAQPRSPWHLPTLQSMFTGHLVIEPEAADSARDLAAISSPSSCGASQDTSVQCSTDRPLAADEGDAPGEGARRRPGRRGSGAPWTEKRSVPLP